MRNWQKHVALLGTICFACLTGCFRYVSVKELPGTFKMKSDWACGELVLNQNRTFHQSISLHCTNTPVSVDGMWTPDVDGAGLEAIVFTPFLSKTDQGGLTTLQSHDPSVLKLRWKTVRILAGPDAGIYYEK
jgi:hypothetical protein